MRRNFLSKYRNDARNRGQKPLCRQRQASFESLESRCLLTAVGLNAISNVTLPAGTSVMVALNGSDPTSGKTVNFGVSSSDSTKVASLLMPQSNPSLQFNIAGYGTMTFQLFANLTPNTVTWIENLVNGGLYTGDYIYRAETGSFALIQGGNNPPQVNNGASVNPFPSSVGSTTTINEEFNPDLNYTTAGALAMARQSTANTSSSEFFITDGATRSLDYAYSLFGFQTGDSPNNGSTTPVLQQLDALPTTPTNGINYLTNAVKINSASIITDTQNGVLMLRAPTGATGSYTVTVTAFDDGTNTATTRTFTVNVVPDAALTASNPPTTNPWSAQTPAAPTSIVFQPQTGQGTTTLTSANDAATTSELKFLVSGVTSGNSVTVYADGEAIGSATASSTSVVVTTDGLTTLLDGAHTFTATQTALSQAAADAGDSSLSETANVDSFTSASVQVTVSASLVLTSTPPTTAKVGQVYTYTVTTNVPSVNTITVTPGTMPTGMTFNASTNTFTWTPTSAQVNTSPTFSASVTDLLSHTAAIGPVNIAVAAGVPTTSIPVNVTLGGDVTVLFSGTNVLIYDNIGKTALTSALFDSTDSIEIDCPAGQANSVLVLLPTSTNATLPKNILVQGATGSTNNQVTVFGTNGTNTFTLTNGNVVANGLIIQTATVQKLTLAGRGGNDDYVLTSSNMPTWVVDTGGTNTMDFSHDTAGVTVNLGLSKGQSQTIAPWSTTLSIYGVIGNLIGTPFADTLVGGAAAVTEIHSGLGNDTVTGGSVDNILMGGGGNDTLRGGLGKNLIIGGSGNDSLYTAGSQNTIVAGSTSQDSNDQALMNLLEQPSRVSYGYSLRRDLASAAGSSALSSTPVTFVETGATDTIFGNPNTNWFMLGAHTTVKS